MYHYYQSSKIGKQSGERIVKKVSVFKKIIGSLEIGKKQKMSGVFMLVAILSVVSLLISNVVANKSVELFGWTVAGQKLSIAASFVVFPFTYIASDIFSEVYGYAWSRKISWIALFANIFMVLCFKLVTVMPGMDSATSEAFAIVCDSTPGIVFASLTAFMAGDLLNDLVFAKMKAYDSTGKVSAFAFRSILSSLCGEIVDCIVFLPLLYYFIHGYGTIITNVYQLLTIVLIQALLKTSVELVLCPVSVLVIGKIKAYEESVK